jgi:hypothetical protein
MIILKYTKNMNTFFLTVFPEYCDLVCDVLLLLSHFVYILSEYCCLFQALEEHFLTVTLCLRTKLDGKLSIFVFLIFRSI